MFILWKGKGDLQDLNTHRGVVLLDVISKVVCKLVTSRLATLAEHVCGESELAYRKGRGCSDGLFTLRRLLQEWRGTFPHGQPAEDSQLYILFVDLSKAFDGVPREDLWRLLHHRLGVPVHIISMLKSIYSGMQTRVCDPCGALSPPFDMGTGVRQGSVEGLSFFSCTLPLSSKSGSNVVFSVLVISLVFRGSALKMDAFVNLLVFGPLLPDHTSSTTPSLQMTHSHVDR